MTLTTTTDRVTYQGNGTTIVFPYAFKIFEASHLLVTLTEDDTGDVTTLVLNTDYTVSGAGGQSGGDVTLITAPADGFTLLIKRVVPLVQLTDLTNQGEFYPELHEDAFDYLTMIAQGNAADAERSLQLSVDGSVWDAEDIRIANLEDGVAAQDAVTIGQLENAIANALSGTTALTPRYWLETSVGGNVYQIPGGELTRPESYVVSIDGIEQPPTSYTVGVASDPFVIVLDANPAVGATIMIRALGSAETLASGNFDAGDIVSGIIAPARLGTGSATSATFLRGDSQWANELTGPLTVTDFTFSGTIAGAADASLITTGFMDLERLGSGVPGPSTFLRGDGTWVTVSAPGSTSISIADGTTSSTLMSDMFLDGEAGIAATAPVQVDLYIKEDMFGGSYRISGYIQTGGITESAFSAPALSVLGNDGAFPDAPIWMEAATNHHVLRRLSNTVGFGLLNVAGIDATGTPDSDTFLRGDGSWTAVTASLGSDVETDPLGATPTFPGGGTFYRGDSKWANTILGNLFVVGAGGTTPIFQMGTSVGEVTLSAATSIGNPIRVGFNTGISASSSGGAYLTGSDSSDRVLVNGRIRAVRMRGEGGGMERIQVTATSGSVTLDHNAYGHFMCSPTAPVAFTFTDGGTDPTTGIYASEFTLEIFAPGANAITYTNTIVWGGGTAPTLSAGGVNILQFRKRQGTANYIGALLVGGASGAFSTEDAQDAVGAMIGTSSTVALTYNDATPLLSASVVAGSIGPTQIATGGVLTANIAAGNVTNDRIAAAGVNIDRLSATGTRDASTFLRGDNTWAVPPGAAGGGQAQIQFKDEGVNVGSLGAIASVNFVGAGITTTAVGTALTVTVGAAGAINWADDGFVVGSSTTYSTLSFGTGLSVTATGPTTMRVDATGGGGGGGQAPIQFQDEGVAVGGLGALTSFNVVGAGATLSVAGTAATLTVPGVSSGGGAIYDVMDFGAIGNGSTDDHAAITAAIAAADPLGGTVYFPPGVYRINSTISLGGKKVSLSGAGRGVSVIDWGGSLSAAMVTIAGVTSYTRITDLWFRGGSVRPTQVFSIGSLAHAFFARVRITNFTGVGINAKPDTSFVTAWNHFEQIEIDARNGGITTTAVGIRLDGGNGSPTIPNCCHNTFLNCNVQHNDNTYGVDMLDSDNNTFWQLFTYRQNPWSDTGAGIRFGTNARANTVFHCQADVVANGASDCKNAVYYNDFENGVSEPEVSGAAEILWTSSGTNAFNGMNFRTATGTYRIYFDTSLGDVVFSAPNSGGVKRANSI